jgi:uncharacterized protein YdaU (DUF1376 family)
VGNRIEDKVAGLTVGLVLERRWGAPETRAVVAGGFRGEWFWVDRFKSSVAFHMPMEAKGIHRSMLSEAWICGGRLPNDHRAIRIAIGCEKDEWERCWPMVSKFWREVDGYLVNDDQRETFEKTERLSIARSEAGSKGASKREANRQAKPQAKGDSKRMSPDQSLSLSQEQDQSPDQHHTHTSPSAPGAAAPKRERGLPPEVSEVFDHWREVCRHQGAKLDGKRQACIRARLRDGYSAADLKEAIDGCAASRFHQGRNDKGKVFDALTLILRDGDHVDQFRKLARGEGQSSGERDAKTQDVMDRLDRAFEQVYGPQQPALNGQRVLQLTAEEVDVAKPF